MSALRYGVQCVPAGQVMLPGIPGMVTPEPTHVGCPGGEHQPGVIGGWTCPCDCHRRPPVSVPEATPAEPAEVCGRKLPKPSSAWWMNDDQWDADACRCILPSGHTKPRVCKCEHDAPVVSSPGADRESESRSEKWQRLARLSDWLALEMEANREIAAALKAARVYPADVNPSNVDKPYPPHNHAPSQAKGGAWVDGCPRCAILRRVREPVVGASQKGDGSSLPTSQKGGVTWARQS